VTEHAALAELIAAAESIRAAGAARDPWLADLPVAGIGWAKVELDRADRELSGAGPCSSASRVASLVGSARRSPSSKPGSPESAHPAIVLLEPDTEGPLAAVLARFGEGVLAVYLGPLDRADVDDTPRLGPPRSGPLGPARLVIGRPAWGRHVFVLAGVAPRSRDDRGPTENPIEVAERD
jgi:hypothetical protein